MRPELVPGKDIFLTRQFPSRLHATPASRDNTWEAYKLALTYVGRDKDSRDIWLEYMQPLRSDEVLSPPPLFLSNPTPHTDNYNVRKQGEMDSISKAYQPRLSFPISPDLVHLYIFDKLLTGPRARLKHLATAQSGQNEWLNRCFWGLRRYRSRRIAHKRPSTRRRLWQTGDDEAYGAQGRVWVRIYRVYALSDKDGGCQGV